MGINGRIAAWLTQRLGSMWVFCAAAGTQVVWMGLAELGVQRFDPYPFTGVTGVAIINGADNVAIYTPLFRSLNWVRC